MELVQATSAVRAPAGWEQQDALLDYASAATEPGKLNTVQLADSGSISGGAEPRRARPGRHRGAPKGADVQRLPDVDLGGVPAFHLHYTMPAGPEGVRRHHHRAQRPQRRPRLHAREEERRDQPGPGRVGAGHVPLDRLNGRVTSSHRQARARRRHHPARVQDLVPGRPGPREPDVGRQAGAGHHDPAAAPLDGLPRRPDRRVAGARRAARSRHPMLVPRLRRC